MRGQVSKERTVAFSDGVFAIAITLLVLSVEIPDLHDQSSAALDRELDATLPDVLSYFIGFFVIGTFWIGHHRFFDSLRAYDARLMYANLVYLSLIALLPFPTAVLGDHGTSEAAVIVYAVAVALAGLAEAAMLWLALDRDLLGGDEQANPRPYLLRALAVPAVFLASIPVAAVSPDVAPWTWLALLAIPRIGRRAGTVSSG